MSDVFRDRPGRWLGYAHVVGSALPSELVSPVGKVWMSRTTGAYIIFDVVHKAMDSRRPNAAVKGVDALLWQGLASVLVPTLVVDLLAKGSNMAVQSLKVAKPMNRFIPAGVVVLAMPLFGGTIDRVTDVILDNTTRFLFNM